jgi:uncharacterized protein
MSILVKRLGLSLVGWPGVKDFVAQRAPFRFEHLRMVREAHERGELLLAGALGDPADRALLVFYVEAETAVAQFAQNDPYVSNGLVRRWEVLPWAVVVGGHSFMRWWGCWHGRFAVVS